MAGSQAVAEATAAEIRLVIRPVLQVRLGDTAQRERLEACFSI